MKFGSSERVNNYENVNFFPGPGHYDSKNMVGHSKAIPKGQRPAAKSAFGQTSNRFNGDPKHEFDLGPGYYFGQKEWQSKKFYKENKAQFYPNPRKIITIPSIPSSTHAMGYVEREDGYLIPLNGSSVKDENDLGPGAYEANDKVVKKKVHGFNFNRITSPRFPEEKPNDDQKNRITLGNYTLPKREIEETEPEQKKKDPPKKVLTPEEEARRLQAKLEENPGMSPGYYYNEKIASSFNVQNKPLEFQNFGTTAKRFTAGGKPTPGPGFYNPPASEVKRAPYMKVEPYSKGDQRFKSAILDELPGPGTYTANYSSNTEVNWTSQTGFPSAFGSGMTRFVAPKSAQSEQPGPGSYNPFKNSRKNKKRKNKPAITSITHTVTPQKGTTPNFSRDFGYATDLDLGGRSKGAVVVKHEDPANKGTSAFQSVGQRFVQDKDKRSMTPGPGSYEYNQAKFGVKPTHNTLKTTFSITPRGHESKGEVYKKMLGPGVYDYSLDPVKQNINYAPKINPVVPAYGAMLPK